MKNKSSLSLNKNNVTNGFNIGQYIKVANISLYVLAAICFMVYTTQNYTHAEGDDEDLGYDITSANASVTVGTACTFTATVDSEHNATIANGIYSTDIGKTTLNTICNDSGGYAVYAIGYTGDEYGATDLSSDISSTYNISTGTNTSGDSSSWAMKLASEPGTTTATIENGYNNYNIVPDDYTKVASLNTVTDNTSTTSTTGSSISTTYQTYISPTQPAGTYTGKVKYALVHPSTAPKPEKPITIEQAYQKSGATKTAQGYYKMQDMTSAINESVDVIGDSLQVQDIRDNKIYWITKLKDGNIWMTQNLDFGIVNGGANINPTNTDVPANWADAGNLANTYTTGTTTWNGSTTAPESYDPGSLYWNGEMNTNWSGTLNNMTADSGDTHYHIGNYYNWNAAVAMSNSSSYNKHGQDINQSICPAGWRLPTHNGNKSYDNLVSVQGLIASASGNIQNTPTYFVYGGRWNGSSANVGTTGVYWSSVVFLNSGLSHQLRFTVDSSHSLEPQSYDGRGVGCSLRCVAR